MTVLFCDVKGFIGVSEEMTPQGLVKVMNRYFSTMSAPIHEHGGIIDKYIGDAIMAYWGPPFTEDADQARFASLAALDMLERVAPFRAELPDLLGLRNVPISFDIRIGIATGEALVGSIGSEVMMSYTVMGDTVNLASRLEGANKVYGGRILASEATVAAAGAGIETREIDRVVAARPEPLAAGVRDHGPQRRLSTESRSSCGRATPRALPLTAARRWEEARPRFHRCARGGRRTTDRPSPCSSASIVLRHRRRWRTGTAPGISIRNKRRAPRSLAAAFRRLEQATDRRSVLGYEPCLDGRQTLLQFYEFVFRKVPGASGRDALGTLKQACPKIGMRRAPRDVAVGTHQPETDRDVGNGIVPDLLKRVSSRPSKLIHGTGEPQYMRRSVIMRWRRQRLVQWMMIRLSWSTQLIAVLGSLTAGDIARSPISTIWSDTELDILLHGAGHQYRRRR